MEKFGNTTRHSRRALDLLREWVSFLALFQKKRAEKITLRMISSAIFAGFAIIWAEAALFFALAGILPPHFAALIVLVTNLVALGLVNVFATSVENDRELLESARERRAGAVNELSLAKNDLIEEASELMRERYRTPLTSAAAVGAFIFGLTIARVLTRP